MVVCKTFWTERTLTYPPLCQTVPLDAANLFINPNQTLADIIPDRNLGLLSSLKIMDADLIIRNLNNKLNAALLQRMDQHQKQIEAQVAELKAETKVG